MLYEGVQSLDVTGPLEVFTAASRYQEARGLGPAYQISTASPAGRPVTTSSGLRLIPDGALRAGQSADTVVVPGGNNGAPAPGLVHWLRDTAGRTRRIASVCTGAFVLAEAGLLAGRRATTHWAYADSLARRFPDVEVDARRDTR